MLSTLVLEVTNVFLWVTRKTDFFHVSLRAQGTQDFMVEIFRAPCNFSRTTALDHIQSTIVASTYQE